MLETPLGVDLVPADPNLMQVTVEKMPATNSIRENNRMLLRHLALLNAVLGPLKSDYDYVLIDSHPELSDLLRTVVYACDYCVSPVRLDLQSTIGVPSALEAINEVNGDMEMIQAATGENDDYVATQFAGSIGVMAREWGGILIGTQRVEYRRLERVGPVFGSYVTEGDGIRQAAQYRRPVYDVNGSNADKQAEQYRRLTEEFMRRCPS